MRAWTDTAPVQHRHEEDDHPPAISQSEADAIACNLNMDGIFYVHVHWIEGNGGRPQALLHPIHYGPEDWIN